MKKKGDHEILTGLIIGLILGLLMFHKIAFGAPVNNQYDAERAQAEAYLDERDIEVPKEVRFWCEYYGDRYEISPEILEAVCWVESRFVSFAQSPDKECKGLMQIKPSCHTKRMQRLNALNVFGVADNIKIGTDYLAELGGSEDVAVALAIYNGQSESRIEKTRQGEYSGYVSEVLEISAALERIHNK